MEMDNQMTKTQFCNLINEYQRNLFRLAKSILKNDADAEDAVGEAILKSYASLHTLKDDASFRPWLFRILVNEAYASANRRKRTVYLEDMTQSSQMPQAAQTEQNPPVPDTDLDLWETVNQLEDDFRTVTILFYYEDLSLKDIASALHLPEGTVKSRLSRARLKLKKIIADNGERETGG